MSFEYSDSFKHLNCKFLCSDNWSLKQSCDLDLVHFDECGNLREAFGELKENSKKSRLRRNLPSFHIYFTSISQRTFDLTLVKKLLHFLLHS